MHRPFQSDKFKHHGREFVCELYDDNDSGPPWKNSDGHGPVSKWTLRLSRAKKSNERVLCEDRSSYRFYDMQRATRMAWKDGWGLGEKELVELSTKLKRTPTKGDIIHAAVERDFQFLRGWCNDDWRYIGVVVRDVISGDTDSLWGIESNGDYWQEVRDELAGSLHPLAEAHEATDLEVCSD